MEKYTGFSGPASLATVGLWMKKNGLWQTVEAQLKIEQKVIVHRPSDKVKDLFINILAGGHGIADVNNRLRVDKALQLSFGRKTCAEQSTISETLNASNGQNALELAGALQQIYQKHSAGYRHNYQKKCQVLDIDLSALLAGKQAEEATKGYFSGQKSRRGRQLARVTATHYDEIVGEKLYNGKVQLEKNLPELIGLAENVLELDETRRKRTVLRVDAGGGTDANINFYLARDYLGLTKVKNWQRTCKLVKTVTKWQGLPQLPDHECGWVGVPHDYVRPTRQLAMRWPNKKKGDWRYCVLVFNLSDDLLFELAGRVRPQLPTELELLVAIVDAYDLRGGGVETSFKNSKQGLGLSQRNKKSFPAQEMLVLLAQLAYNLTRWVQNELAKQLATIAAFGLLRMIRDAFQIAGKIEFDEQGTILLVTLNKTHKLAKAFYDTWKSLFACDDPSLILNEI